jgi:hypothetical protein
MHCETCTCDRGMYALAKQLLAADPGALAPPTPAPPALPPQSIEHLVANLNAAAMAAGAILGFTFCQILHWWLQ